MMFARPARAVQSPASVSLDDDRLERGHPVSGPTWRVRGARLPRLLRSPRLGDRLLELRRDPPELLAVALREQADQPAAARGELQLEDGVPADADAGGADLDAGDAR
jgi:hypothetical protein